MGAAPGIGNSGPRGGRGYNRAIICLDTNGFEDDPVTARDNGEGPAEAPSPTRTEFMDPAMRETWRALGPMPYGLRLVGGTALALYLNHRASTDFDFATAEPVVTVENMSGLDVFRGKGISAGGGLGIIDIRSQEEGRVIQWNFIEFGLGMPPPAKPPLAAPNGVAVAHPQDILTMKLEALCERKQLRDYRDVAAIAAAWPGLAEPAVSHWESVANGDRHRLCREIVPPPAVAGELDKREAAALERLAAGISASGPEELL